MTPLMCSFQRLMGRTIAALTGPGDTVASPQHCKVKVFRCMWTHVHALQHAQAVASNVGTFRIVGVEEKPWPVWTLPGNSQALVGACKCTQLLDRTLGTHVLLHTMH